jgi:hypothetical protein
MKNRGDAHHRYSALVADRRRKLDGSVTDDLSDIRRGGRGSVSLGRIFDDPLTRGLFDPSAPIHRLPHAAGSETSSALRTARVQEN